MRSEYRVKVMSDAERIVMLEQDLELSRRETCRALGALSAVEEQLKRAVQRAGELQAKVYALEGQLGDEREAHEDELSVRQSIGYREGRTL
jgi:hypothetical protein